MSKKKEVKIHAGVQMFVGEREYYGVIPSTFAETEKLSNEVIEDISKMEKILFFVTEQEALLVSHWFCYPTYDFIIGEPFGDDNPRVEKESACLVTRYKNGKQYATYFDGQELEDIGNGLLELLAKQNKKQETK